MKKCILPRNSVEKSEKKIQEKKKCRFTIEVLWKKSDLFTIEIRSFFFSRKSIGKSQKSQKKLKSHRGFSIFFYSITCGHTSPVTCPTIRVTLTHLQTTSYY